MTPFPPKRRPGQASAEGLRPLPARCGRSGPRFPRASMRLNLITTFGSSTADAMLTATSAMAASAFHPEPTEAGAQFHTQHVTQKNCSEVQAELRQA